MIETARQWGEFARGDYIPGMNSVKSCNEFVQVRVMLESDWQRIEALMRMVAGMPDNDDCEWLMEMRHHAREMGFGE